MKLKGTLKFLLLACFASATLVAELPTYFVAAERSTFYNDSFLIPMTKSADIEEARAQIRGEVGPDFMHVRIAAGGDGLNRNYRALGAPAWSWHVSKFERFVSGGGADWRLWLATSIEALGVEEVIKSNGFYEDLWVVSNYKIVSELAPVLSLKIQASGNELILAWPKIGERYRYTVETSDSLTEPDWQSVPGFAWPTTERSITIQTTETKFFRVRAGY